MRRFGISVCAVLLGACAAPIKVHDAPVSGRVHDLSVAEIEAAIAGMQADLPEVRSQQLRLITVNDTNTVLLTYHEAGEHFDATHVVKRVRGRWRYTWLIVGP